MNAIYFDMDGTVYDLYGVENWEARLNAEDATPYCEGCPLVDMDELNDTLAQFVALGFTIGVITWTAMHGSKDYNKAVRKVKRTWVRENMPCVSEFHCVKYGTPKHRVAKCKKSALVDDNAEVRHAWKNGITVDASNCEETVKILKELLTMLN